MVKWKHPWQGEKVTVIDGPLIGAKGRAVEILDNGCIEVCLYQNHARKHGGTLQYFKKDQLRKEG